ncbi:hypothetical protein C5167_004366 [Papaver somniferum]|uniref:Signal peptide peptidase-like 1 n=2 Tax=Papaver somniferum TaxID=3469 RepID=A0A4Y7JAG8_PAPSO|nr:hypothetical protein C5167_004366 [Papaver somniferum]
MNNSSEQELNSKCPNIFPDTKVPILHSWHLCLSESLPGPRVFLNLTTVEEISVGEMESLWKLTFLFAPAPMVLILTAIAVTFAAAQRALYYRKEMERNRDFSEASITLDRSQALMIPIMSSCSLILLFYLFSSVSQFLTAFTAVASMFSLYFCFSPYVSVINTKLGIADPYLSRCCSKSFTRTQGVLVGVCVGTVISWLVTGHWVLNNLLGISICIAFVSHVRLPNIKICALLLVCLFVYDIFWVFFSERFFGANVMVSVATRQASNPVHTVANSLSLPGLQLITKKLELPVKIVFPRSLMSGAGSGSDSADFMMLGLGDMAIPGMLLALVLCFDHRRTRDSATPMELSSTKGQKYIWYAVCGYAIGLVTALAAGILSQSPQPALLYLVPSTLGPVMIISWFRKELVELWEGNEETLNDKSHVSEV